MVYTRDGLVITYQGPPPGVYDPAAQGKLVVVDRCYGQATEFTSEQHPMKALRGLYLHLERRQQRGVKLKLDDVVFAFEKFGIKKGDAQA